MEPAKDDIDHLRDVRQSLAQKPGSKWGWVIFRTTYGDDAQWERFMNHLNTRVRLTLEEQSNGDLFDRIDWAVQESPRLRDASHRQVREIFRTWKSTTSEPRDMTARFEACMVVGKYEIEAVLEDGPPAEEQDPYGTGWVTIVSASAEEGDTAVGVSSLTEAYAVLQLLGWESIQVGDGDVFCT